MPGLGLPVRICAITSLLLTIVAAATLAFATTVYAADTLRGVALVIGNGEYEHLNPLANPPDDADAIEALLSDLGFDSVRRSDRDAKDLARDLERFVEDAEGADVAVLYYAGHGIEAGGENFLIPVDADISALDDAAEKLVPVSDVLRRLRETVAVTIILLDACRDNPFPPDATLRLTAGAAALPIAAGGLAVADTRGATSLARTAAPAAANDNYGAVIGFAASPGQVAMDGEKGEHSPYAAALIRHIDAMAGQEFGTVMRMVAEEVYLKTGGRQRPWVNESLRRLLYFGDTPKPVTGPDGEILTERRSLLLTIAALPDAQRAKAETLSQTGNVPISVVFAMIRAAGIDPNDDPATLEARLRSEIDRFAASRSARDALNNPDPEIQRLTRLADDAELEGALNAANDFRDQAKERVAALRSTRQEQADALRQRFIEDAEVYARSAETKLLLFQYVAAARDYGEAFAIVAKWDEDNAFDYRRFQLEAYKNATLERGDLAALDEGEGIARAEVETPAINWSPDRAARFAKLLGQIILVRARLDSNQETLAEGQHYLQRALELSPPTSNREKGAIFNDLGVTALTRAEKTNDDADYEEASEALRNALEFFDPGQKLGTALTAMRDAASTEGISSDSYAAARGAVAAALDPENPNQQISDWAMAQHNLGVALRGLSRLRKDPALREQALSAYDFALRARTAAGNLHDAASTQMNIGNIHYDISDEGVVGEMDKAVDAYEKAVGLLDSKAYPIPFADAVLRLSNAVLLDRDGASAVSKARILGVLQEAASAVDPGAAGADLAEIHNNIGRSFYALALEDKNADEFTSAADAYRQAIALWGKDPASTAVAYRNLGFALFERGNLTGDEADFRDAADAHGRALGFWTPSSDATEYAATRFAHGQALHEVANRTDESADYAAAADDYRAALSVWEKPDANENWPYAQRNLGHMLFAGGLKGDTTAPFEQAADAFARAASAFADIGQPAEQADSEFETGRAWHEIGYRTADRQAYAKALDAYEKVSSVGARDASDSELRGYASYNIASVYRSLSLAGDTEKNLRAAVEAYRLSIVLAGRDADAGTMADRRATYAGTAFDLAQETGDSGDFDIAIAAYEAQLAHTQRNDAPLQWASSANALGNALTAAGKAAGNPAKFEKAISLLSDATRIQTEQNDTLNLAYSQDTLCLAQIELGRANSNAGLVTQGLSSCESALATFRSNSLDQVAAISLANIESGKTLLEQLAKR